MQMALYSFILMFSFIMLLLMIHRIYNSYSTELTLFFAGTVMLTLTAWVYTSGHGIDIITNKGVTTSFWDPFFLSYVAMTLAFMSAGAFTLIDRAKNISPYYTTTILILAIIFSYSSIYGSYTAEILQWRLFSVLAFVSLAVLIICPIIAYLKKISNIHVLWSVPGWIIIYVVAFMHNSKIPVMQTEDLTVLDNFQTLLFGILIVAFLFLLLEVGLTDWKFTKQLKEE